MLRTVTKAMVSSGSAFSNAGAAQLHEAATRRPNAAAAAQRVFMRSFLSLTQKTAENFAAKRRKRNG